MLYNDFTRIVKTSALKTYHELQSEKNKKTLNENRKNISKRAGDSKINLLHLKYRKAYTNYKLSNWNKELRVEFVTARQNFRCRKRYNQKHLK